MKRLWIVSAIIFPLILFGFFTSCDNAGGLSGYYIYAELDGTAYEWRLGLTDIEDDAFGSMGPGTTDVTGLFATPDVATGDDEPNNFVLLIFEGIAAGTYTTFETSGYYFIDGKVWMFSDITIVVTTYESVGGVIVGTFSGTVSDEQTNTMTVKNGQFNVIHAPDDSFNP